MALCAVAPLPLVLAFQYTGGALPQWGGRYLLTSGFLLAAVGAAALGELARWARLAIVGMAVAVSALGVAWLVVRTHQVGDALEPLRQRPEEVLIWTDGFLPREFAAIYGEGRWLAGAERVERLAPAINVARRVAPATIGFVTTGVDGEAPAPSPDIPGYRVTGREQVPFLDPVYLDITTYAADAVAD